MSDFIEKLNFNDKGLMPAVIQDSATKKVLTLCYMNADALKKTLREGKIYLFRRSKNKLMIKGGTSGHIQIVKAVYVDCAENSLLFEVEQKVAACHMGYFSCYYRKVDKDGNETIGEKRVFDPDEVYKKG
jgi:phosphoribosyl-AMP cyclohydrolase